MKYHNLYRILTAILVFSLAMIPCLAWADTSVSISGTAGYDKGVSTISWTTSGTEPSAYYVFAEAVNHGSSAQSMIYLGETATRSIQTTELAPGVSYTITIVDGQYNILGLNTCRVPDVPDFADGKLTGASVKVSVSKRQMDISTRKYQDIQVLSGKKISASFDSNDVYYGVKYQMKMPQLAKARAFFATLVFESPDGFVYVDRAVDMTFDRVNNGYQTLWWEIAGVNFFYELNRATGGVPAGTYTIRLYWDGMFVNASTFDVGV